MLYYWVFTLPCNFYVHHNQFIKHIKTLMAALIIIIFGRWNNSKDFCYLFKKKMDILINILHFFYNSLLRLIISFAIINYIWKLSTYNLSKKIKDLKVNICICFLEIHIGLIYSICFFRYGTTIHAILLPHISSPRTKVRTLYFMVLINKHQQF